MEMKPFLEVIKNELPDVAAIIDILKIELPVEELSLSELLEKAENKKNEGNLKESLAYFALALELDKRSTFIMQRIVLLTYKIGEPDKRTALKLAEGLLVKYLRPDEVIDVETFGLSGAIYKRLAEIENEKENIDKSIKYYEKGYLVCGDYYNGINCAYMYLLSATKQESEFEKIANYANARKAWLNVIDICDKELQRISNDPSNKNIVWILQSKAEAMFGLNSGETSSELQDLFIKIEKLDNQFERDAFQSQHEKMKELLKTMPVIK